MVKADVTLRQVSHQADLFSLNAIGVDNATLLVWEKKVVAGRKSCLVIKP
jgi:hypothetical protein